MYTSSSNSYSRSVSPYVSDASDISDDEESVITSTKVNRESSSSEDSIKPENNSTPKSLNVKRQDKVTHIAGLLSEGIETQQIASKLNADKNPGMQFTVGMSKDEFISRAQELGLTQEEARQITSNLQSYFEALQNPDTQSVTHAEQHLKNAENLPPVVSDRKRLGTNLAAGAAGYLTSFFWGKLFSSLLVLGAGSRGAWAFPLTAGPLNVLLSEPIVGAIRAQGAFHPSVDGAAYTDYNTASARLAKASYLNDTKAITHWTLVIAKIVNSVIDREQKHPNMWFQSGAEKLDISKHGFALDENGKVKKEFSELAENVITGARRRSLVSDELPFTFFTINYLLSGLMQPFMQNKFSPPVAMAIDVGLSALLGTISGAQTGMMQDFMRQVVQRAPLKNLSTNIKGAKMAIAAARRDECLERLNKICACVAILNEKLSTINAVVNKGDVQHAHRIKKAEDDLAMAMSMKKTIDKAYAKARRKHDDHSTRHNRCSTAVGVSVNSYLGEKSDPPQPLQGRRAINRVIAKTLATPLSLVFTPLYTSVIVPAILHAVSSAIAPLGSTLNQSVPDNNFTFNGSQAWQASNPISGNHTQPDMESWSMGLSALFGLPLILGYMTRNQIIAPAIEKGIAYLEAVCGTRDTSSSSETDSTASNQHESLDESTEVSLPSNAESDDNTDTSSRVMSSNKQLSPSRSQNQNQNEEDYASSIV